MRYIRTLLITSATAFCSIGLINWFIDPFGMYWSRTYSAINQIKPEAGNRSRIVKAYRAINVSPKILIVGNSRIEMGIEPTLDNFELLPVYNQGMPGAKLHMQIDYAKDLIYKTPQLKEVIMSVDFLDFLIAPSELANQMNIDNIPQEYDNFLQFKSPSYIDFVTAKAKNYYKLIFSLDALQASISTVFNQNSTSSSVDPMGFNTAKGYLSIINHEGYGPLYQQKINWLLDKLASEQWILYPNTSTSISPKFEQLKTLIDLCQSKNIAIKLFINPYHFTYMHTLYKAGYWQDFLQWKIGLTHFLYDNYQNRIRLWDFSLINERTSEQVILSNVEPKWFWEPAHYKKSFGDTIIETLYSEEDSTEFGVILNPKNIENVMLLQDQKLKKTENRWVFIQERLNINKAL